MFAVRQMSRPGKMMACVLACLVLAGGIDAPGTARADALGPASRPALAKNARCHVVVRYDDYAPYYEGVSADIDMLNRLLDCFAARGGKLVTGVIPFPRATGSAAPDAGPGDISDSWLLRPNEPLVQMLRTHLRKGSVELALHGFEHRQRRPQGYRPGEFLGQPYLWQYEALRLGRDALAAATGQSVRVFVPPWNSWDDNTLAALRELGFAWCSPDAHHDSRDAAGIRLAPQCTADPQQVMAMIRAQPSLPAGSVIVLTTHPFDFAGPAGRSYLQSLEAMLDLVAASPDWACVGFTDLPDQSAQNWSRRFTQVVRWQHTLELAGDIRGLRAAPAMQPGALRPAEWYDGPIRGWQAAIAAALAVSAMLAWLVARGLTRRLVRSRRLALAGVVLAAIALVVLLVGAVDLLQKGYHVRGIRWQAICVLLGAALGIWPPGRTRPLGQPRGSVDGLQDAPDGPGLGRYVHLLRRSWYLTRTRVLWGWRLHSMGRRVVLCRPLQVPYPGSVAIGSRVTILDGFALSDLAPGRGTAPKIVIGDGTRILYRFQCNAADAVHIGRNVLIASNVLVTDSDHVVEPGGVPVTQNPKLVTRPVRIEDNCWIGQNAVILKGVTVGHDSIVGANSVVTRDVPPCSIVAGNPARVIKSLAPAADAKPPVSVA